MKISKTTLFTLLALTAVGVVVYIARQQQEEDCEGKLAHIADEGYETANDILYPNTGSRDKNLRYGPVLPE
ncbi:MAG: hypothetical protein EOO03_05270 [Chitinophagaceae bacterium]|nr:MAG: hypothetical protein EOO03_05270 [Chitinophagaceae bacterium]